MSLSQSAVTFADKLIIGPIFGFAILGVYQFGFQFLIFLSVIPTSLLQYLIPQEASGIQKKGIRKLGMTLALAMAGIFFFIGPPIIVSLFPKYTEAVPIAQIMAFGIIPLTVNALINSRLLGTENTKPILIGSIVYTLSLVFALLYLGTAFGIVGLAFASVMSLSLQSATLLLLTHHQRSSTKSKALHTPSEYGENPK
jgi:O-antigen/teichoic acid export membrane protein